MSPGNKVHFSLTEFEQRDVPSMSPITVEKPAEYATASAAYQQTYDSVISNTLSQVSPDGALSADGISPLPLFNSTIPTAAQPPEDTTPRDVPTAAPADAQRQLTPAETAEIKKLVDLLARIRAEKANVQVSQATWAGLLATQNTTLNALKAQLPNAQADLKTAQDALAKHDLLDGRNGPQRNTLIDALGQAKGRLKGVQDSIAVVENLLKNIQQRIDFINGWITRYNDQISAINQRIGEITAAAAVGQPSGAAPATDFVPYPNLPSDAGDWRKPMPVIPGVTAPSTPTTPTTPTPPPSTTPPTGGEDGPDDGSTDPAQSPTNPTPAQYENDPLAPIVV